jgi:hypothetical protein
MEHQVAQGDDSPEPGDIAGAYKAKSSSGQPEGLTLEKLRLSFVENVYFAGPDQGWFQWGVSWGRRKSYSNLTDFETDLHIDKGGRVWEPAFVDLIGSDFRLSGEAMKNVEQNYPQGLVPGVSLGVRQ